MACEPFDCERCGQRHTRCSHDVFKDNEGNPIDPRPCNKWPRKGSSVCQKHGGNAPQVIAAGAERLQLEEARQAARRLGAPIDIDQGGLLIDMVQEAAGNVAFYRTLLDAIRTHPEDDQLEFDADGNPHYTRGESGFYGRTYHQSGIPTGEAKPHILLQLYNEERDRAVNYAKTAAALKIDERRVRLAEATAKELFTAAAKALDAMSVTPEQIEVFRSVFAEQLRNRQPAGLPR